MDELLIGQENNGNAAVNCTAVADSYGPDIEWKQTSHVCRTSYLPNETFCMWRQWSVFLFHSWYELPGSERDKCDLCQVLSAWLDTE